MRFHLKRFHGFGWALTCAAVMLLIIGCAGSNAANSGPVGDHQARIRGKVGQVKAGMQALATAGGEVSSYRQRMERARREISAGDWRTAEAIIDQVLADLPKATGGFFTQRLACEASDIFAAFAPVIATMPAELPESCRPARALPILMMNGTDDPFVPWGGGEVKKGRTRGKGGAVISAEAMLQFWLTQNKCSGQAQETDFPADPQQNTITVTKYDYTTCASGGQVVFYKISGGGHTWPGSASRKFEKLGRLLGPTAHNINATQEIWDFFAHQGR
tara:strand:- start:5110 stop:5934 length:825 start_codon:yes stop_codon:yes gene_type:complete